MKEESMSDCVFCKIIKGEIPSFKVFEDDTVLAIADINPISRGHVLIIPKRHIENMWEATEEELVTVMRTAKKLVHAIKDAINPDGLAVLQLNGKAVNQVVMHYHFHLIPRSKDEGKLTMTEWELITGNMDEIKQTIGQITAAIK
jgi:histidine triad (HIT) family protein